MMKLRPLTVSPAMTGFVLAHGSMPSSQSGEGDIRQQTLCTDAQKMSTRIDCVLTDDGHPFEQKRPRPVAESEKRELAIKTNLRGLGYGG